MSDIAGRLGFAVSAAISPADIATWSKARIDRFFAGLAQAQAACGAQPLHESRPLGSTPAAELNDLERHLMALEATVAKQGDLLEAMADEVAALHGLALGMGERIAAQAELLAKRAEPARRLIVADVEDVAPPPGADPNRPTAFEAARREWLAGATDPEPVATGLRDHVAARAAVAVLDDPEADLGPPVEVVDGDTRLTLTPADEGGYTVTSPGVPGLVTEGETVAECVEMARDAAAELSAARTRIGGRVTSDRRRGKQLALARALAGGPQRMRDLSRVTGIADNSVAYLLRCHWFAKTAPDKNAPWALTDAGRAALRADGYVLVPTAEPETNPAPAETPAPSAGAQAAEREARLIATAIRDAAEPGVGLTLEQIASATGLSEVVVKGRLRSNSAANVNPSYCYFAKRDKGDTWGLTSKGVALAAKGGA